MKQFINLTLLLLALLLPATAIAHDFKVDGIYYKINGNEAEVTYKGTSYNQYSNEYSGDVTIPTTVTYNGTTYSVTSIGNYAFFACRGLTSINIPNSVTLIGDDAFSNCSSLTSVIIPNSVTSIGDYAFNGCTSLTSITIPNSVTSVGNYAFYGTPWFNNQPDGLVYAGLVAYKFKGTMPYGTNITIKDGTLVIAGSAFSGCSGLTSITIPNSVTSIGIGAFQACSSLTIIIIPNSVTSIGGDAFYGCTSLTDITIPNSVTSIGYGAFHDTPWFNYQPDGLIYAGLVAYKYKGTMPNGTNIILKENTRGIAVGAFKGCSGLTSIIIPNSVTSIGGEAFLSCSGLTSVTIPYSVTSIDKGAFHGCSGLTTLNFNAVNCTDFYYDSSLGVAVFSATNISTINIGDQVKRIPGGFAVGMYKLTSITIPNSVTSIGSSAFEGCSRLTSVDIPNSVTSIGSAAFSGCSGLTSLSIPSSVTSIGDWEFNACSSLTSIDIPNSVTSIGYGAFYDCNRLTCITIPNSVTSIESEAFSGCSELNDVFSFIDDPMTVSMGSDVFYLNPSNYAERTLHVPVGTLYAYQANTDWSKYFGSIVEMNETVLATSIELNETSVELTVGKTLQLMATVMPEDATEKTVTWTSSDDAIATVDATGLVTAIAPGFATITATTTDGSNLSANCNLTSIADLIEYDNYLSMRDTTAFHGDTIVIPVTMTNAESILSFQTDIFLPEGLEILQEDGEYMIDPSSRMTRTHSLMSNEVSNGAIRVICYSSNYKPFTGSSGDDLFYITVKVADDAEGDYTISLRNTLFTNADFEEIAAPDVAATLNVKAYLLGDANNSGTVTVTDVVVTSQYVLEMNPNPFVFEAADVNVDGNITVTDVTRIAWMVLNPTLNVPRRAPALYNNGDRMSGEGITLTPGETRLVSILLDNDCDYSAFQLDLTLPEGLSAGNFRLADRAGSHAFDVNMLSNGKIRALCYSPALATIRGNEGAVLTFEVTVDSDIDSAIHVDGIELVTTDCRSVLLDAFDITVNSSTGVNEIANGKSVARVDYYNLAGQRIDRPESGVTLIVTTYTDGTRTTTKLMR